MVLFFLGGMDKKGHRFSIRLKTALMVVAFGLILGSISLGYFNLVSSNRNKQAYKDMASTLSSGLAISVDKDAAKSLISQVVSIYEAEGKPYRENQTEEETQTYLAKFDPIKQSEEYREMQQSFADVRKANKDIEAIYIGYVDFSNKRTVYIVYDHEDEYYPVGIVDPVYEEDYPMLENPMLGFVASIYQDEVEKRMLVTAGAPIVDTDQSVMGYVLVDISMDVVNMTILDQTLRMGFYLGGTLVGLFIVTLVLVHFGLIKPIFTLQIAAKSYDLSKPEQTHKVFSELHLGGHDELSDLSDSMKAMEGDVHERILALTEMNQKLVTAQEEASRLAELAHKDALTGIGNKVAFNEAIEELDKAIRNNEEVSFGLAMVDLNYLKEINDEFGHHAGDIALVKLSNLLNTYFIRSNVYRIGGDEFVVIVKDKDYLNSRTILEDIERKMDEYWHDDSLTFAEKTQAAIGYVTYNPKTDESAEAVLEKADTAMYGRKKRMKKEKPNPFLNK